MNIEKKTFAFEVKSVDEDQGIITGYLSTFGNIDQGNGYIRDRVMPGAFKRTLTHAIERKEAKKSKYLLPHLWMHSPEQPIGGYLEAKEDVKGLLVTYQLDISKNSAGIPNNPTATMVFSGYKNGYVDEQSIGYETLKSETVEEMVDGKKTLVRNLIEIRLYEGSSITSNFAMNDQALVTSVKSLSLEEKSVCGNVSGPLGERDEAWDGSKAEKEIWAVAYDEDSEKINKSLAKKYFMSCDGDGTKKGDYGLPFWYVGDSPHICVGAVKAIAGVCQGARGGSAPDGVKAKVEKLYSRINAKYPDDDPLTPPWKDDEKSVMRNRHKKTNASKEQKTFEQHYAEEMAEDLLEDWSDVYIRSLTQSVLDAFRIGDKPKEDVQEALSAFGTAVMDWVDKAIEYDLAGYIEANDGDYINPEYEMQYGSESRPNYGWMSRQSPMSTKAGRAISASNTEKIQSHVDSLESMASEHEKAMKTHIKAIRTVADDLATILQGSEGAYGTDPGTPAEGQQEGKSTSYKGTRATQQTPSSGTDTVAEDEITKALATLQSLRISQ